MKIDPDWARARIARAAKDSPDRSTKVGCLIIGRNGGVLMTACNEFPPGVADVDARHQRPDKYEWIEHAERDAIFDAARLGIPLLGCRIIQPGYPCAPCARAIIRAGLVELLTLGEPMDPRWGHSQQIGLEMLAEAGVTVTRLFLPTPRCHDGRRETAPLGLGPGICWR